MLREGVETPATHVMASSYGGYTTNLPLTELMLTLTREQPEGWTGYGRRIDAAILSEAARAPAADPLTYVCGPTG